jgi:hypothetical protein
MVRLLNNTQLQSILLGIADLCDNIPVFSVDLDLMYESGDGNDIVDDDDDNNNIDDELQLSTCPHTHTHTPTLLADVPPLHYKGSQYRHRSVSSSTNEHHKSSSKSPLSSSANNPRWQHDDIPKDKIKEIYERELAKLKELVSKGDGWIYL